ncbi:hypothetical protein EYY60_16285 [Flavobacterium zhairuonense]|uniref:hypothetical protein n=1 Tax=Flavobacterium zhairuonense TaxID=2493631 RepID=UPI00104924AE|nr:hypothetical protein [Flavobacterium zhairuonense]KAF2508679.1 hypothetical protein EYY60_16285 [Flavobacterium zhairuonense]
MRQAAKAKKSIIMMEHQIGILKKLRKENIIAYDEMLKIADAFQTASGQGLVIGKTKGMLDFLKNYGEIIVSNDEGIKTVLKTNHDLAGFYSLIDPCIAIEKDVIFNIFFSK